MAFNRTRPPRNTVKKLYHRPRRKYCRFTVEKFEPDWKDVKILRKYISDAVKVIPRKKTGTSAKYQKKLTTAIKRARFMALLPYTVHHLRNEE
ncbi:MAG: 30S ribosomal protein S18 [bacterium]